MMVAADMTPLIFEVRDAELCGAGGSVTFTWIQRSQTFAADALADQPWTASR